MSGHVAYEFAGYRFEPFNARLTRGDEVIPLTGKSLETLLVLVQQPNVLVSKDQLMAAVWPGTVVEENNLNQHISALRKALSQGADSVAIETVPRRGYRLVGLVHRIEPPTGSDAASAEVVRSGVAPSSSLRMRIVVVAAGVLVVVAVAGLNSGWYQRRSATNGVDSAFANRRLSDEAGSIEARSIEALTRGDQLRRQGNTAGAIAEMQEAIRIDPGNARAYASLAHALNALSGAASTSVVRPADQSPSVQAARRAVELDPQCGTCQGTLGLFLFYHDWQFKDAEAHFHEAMRLEPNQESIRPAYAMLLAVTGRTDEAIKQVDIGLATQPYQLSWLDIRASALYFGRKYEEAIATADRALIIRGTERAAWDWRSKSLFQLGRGREALHALSQDLLASHSAELDRAVRSGGVEAGLRKALELTDDWRGRIENAWRRAGWRALLNDTDGALDELERAHEMRRFNAINLGADPVYDKIRAHPRFRKILTGLGLDAWFPADQR